MSLVDRLEEEPDAPAMLFPQGPAVTVPADQPLRAEPPRYRDSRNIRGAARAERSKCVDWNWLEDRN